MADEPYQETTTAATMPLLSKLPPIELPPESERNLRRLNPWWAGQPPPQLPSLRRHFVAAIHRKLEINLAPIVVVRGPRQVGKTTAQLQVLVDLLERGIDPRRILRVQWDEIPEVMDVFSEPILRLVDWYEDEILGKTLNQAAHDGEPAFLFFDEVQILKAWAPQLKFLVDTSTVQVVATGSSALSIERGRDSLAGRITTLEAGVLSLTEIALFHGLDLGGAFLRHGNGGTGALGKLSFWHELRDRGEDRRELRDPTFRLFAERGGYPLAHEREDLEWSELADELNETVIQRVLKKDLRPDEESEEEGLDAALFEAVFHLCCRYAGQAPTAVLLAREAQRSIEREVSPQEVLACLRQLDETLLVRRIKVLEMRLKKERRSNKICLADHSLRASWLEELVPLDPETLAAMPHLAPLAGRIAESIVGAVLSTVRGLDIAHRPGHDRVPELDFVLTVGFKRIPIEVKYQRRIDPRRDTQGMRVFLDDAANQAPFGLLVTQSDTDEIDDPRIVALPLSSLLLLR